MATPVGATLPQCACGGSHETVRVSRGVISAGPVFGTLGSMVVAGTASGLLGPQQKENQGVGFPVVTEKSVALGILGGACSLLAHLHSASCLPPPLSPPWGNSVCGLQ